MAARTTKKEPHPVEELERLRSALDSPQFPRAVLIKGEERYFRDRAVEILCTRATASDLELCRHDARDPDFDVGALCNDLTAAPMFAPGRLVVLRNAGALFNREKREDGEEPDGARPAAVARAILSFVANGHLPAMLVIDSESLRADHAISKSMAAQGNAVFVFRRLYDSPPPWGDPDVRRTELALWLIARAKERQVALVPDQAAYVVAAIGNDLSALDAELERLKRRGSERVEDAVVWTSGASPFELSEHLIRGNLAASLAGVEGLFRFGMRDRDGAREVEPAALLAILFGSMRNKLRQTIARAENEPVGGMAPRAREELEERARLRSAATWRRLLDDLVALERRARSGATVDASDLALLGLRWRVSSARRPARVPRALN